MTKVPLEIRISNKANAVTQIDPDLCKPLITKEIRKEHKFEKKEEAKRLVLSFKHLPLTQTSDHSFVLRGDMKEREQRKVLIRARPRFAGIRSRSVMKPSKKLMSIYSYSTSNTSDSEPG